MSRVGVQESTSALLSARWLYWASWVVSALPVFVVLTSSRWKLTHAASYVAEFNRIGWPTERLELLALLQLTAIVLYVIPRTALLGVVLLTGYLGGAIASYVRIGEFYPPLVPLTTALLAWLGLFLREPRLRALLPIVMTPKS
jgi:hypothetical protein